MSISTTCAGKPVHLQENVLTVDRFFLRYAVPDLPGIGIVLQSCPTSENLFVTYAVASIWHINLTFLC
jgi:hypothetical protein